MNANSGVAGPRAGAAHFEIFSRGRAGVRWRLLSANNRNSGQSGSSFPDVDACRSALDNLLHLLDELRPLYTASTDGRWEWMLARGDLVLARSSHSFDRRLRCVAASEWFIRMAPLATVRTAPRVILDPPPDVTLDIRQPFTSAPYPRYRANLALPSDKSDKLAFRRGTDAGMGTRDGEGG
jgi:hypothetical protein